MDITRKTQRGQALVEWTLLAVAILALLNFCLSLSQKLLDRTVAETWAVFGARAALSGGRIGVPRGAFTRSEDRGSQGKATVWTGKEHAFYKIEIPKDGATSRFF